MEHAQNLLIDPAGLDVVLKRKDEVQNSEEQNVISVLFIGSSGVGKTSLITKLCSGHFTSFLPTIDSSFSLMGATINGKDYYVKLIDTAGQERFESLSPMLYHHAHGFMVVYDISNYDSYERVKYWLLQVQRFSKQSDDTSYPTLLLGNKADVSVSSEHVDGEKVAEDLGMDGFFKTSAKSGEGIKDALKLMLGLVISRNFKAQYEDASVRLDNSDLQQEARKNVCC